MSYKSLANEFKINNPSVIVRWVKEFREKELKDKNLKREEDLEDWTTSSRNILECIIKYCTR
ncbi:hypothetical protein [Anaerococcus sp. AGMB09787]|uniref:hypothetical protein n=1 Tax=Anaerococcus sp. AGMB09787 TaxID=2922869 RepID=UPI001FAFD110|nr:hypothetical protein [Anaerococcus sp. AGMB09787]